MTVEPLGRRERKKAATRQALADAALRLFLEHGYDGVGIRDIAEAADVSTTTLFKHFSGKEALVFDLDEGQEEDLVAAVRDRPEGRTILGSLRELAHRYQELDPSDADAARFRELVDGTRALREYAERMWLRHRTALARAIAEDTGAPEGDPASEALAAFALQAIRVGDSPEGVDIAFDILERGWDATRRA
ncbi:MULTISPECIES: TetR/AcrR family transcriptional regulator [unclassified Streptomyces]|uniref:TetR/AcrR family transcriptional regulator n=1 Tax=unclassified Streptomyces TaxID=2593676 RepID=UPI000DB9F194|nr:MULTISPECIES: TetR/AcrR family transcriptional regulator [unclassified Streptomyces]MYT68625.1 TetR family transcriptional regulator [Streptomyces sp. SID8367]RAJ86297.1 TetR family transcriptional regulator [Streptomyces sp. PsTaAH-137]